MKKIAVKPKVAALLRRVCKRMLAEPNRVEMYTWIESAAVADRSEDNSPACGTVGCIAGWAALDGMSVSKIKKLTARERGKLSATASKKFAKLLGIEENSQEFESLIAVTDWPAEFYDAYVYDSNQESRAKATVARIEHYIKTGE
jgi:hypothetical protein